MHTKNICLNNFLSTYFKVVASVHAREICAVLQYYSRGHVLWSKKKPERHCTYPAVVRRNQQERKANEPDRI